MSVSGGKRRVLLDEIFISADGSVAPCCYLGSEPFHDPEKRIADQNYLKLVELQGGLSRLNMLQHNLYDILKLDIFQKWIPNTWEENGNRSMRPDKCGACCGIEFNALDFGELGDKKNGNIKKNEVNINASQ